jgi:hypothetical protein
MSVPGRNGLGCSNQFVVEGKGDVHEHIIE